MGNSTIEAVLASKIVTDICPDLAAWPAFYKECIKMIHPDVCNHPKANEAIAKLNGYRDQLLVGKNHTDDVGTVKYNLASCEITGDGGVLAKSLSNYNLLVGLSDKSSQHFKQYLPSSGLLSKDKLVWTLSVRAIPLSSLGTLPQEHVNWILSRMLEFVSWMSQSGYVHAGINPDSIYVIPENHGMICVSFYHMTKRDGKVSTASGKYLNFYPSQMFDNKIANSSIDIELAKRTAVYLLGDKSGVGVCLRKTHNKNVVEFLLQHHSDPYSTYIEYRDMLKKNFDTKKFHILNV